MPCSGHPAQMILRVGDSRLSPHLASLWSKDEFLEIEAWVSREAKKRIDRVKGWRDGRRESHSDLHGVNCQLSTYRPRVVAFTFGGLSECVDRHQGSEVVNCLAALPNQSSRDKSSLEAILARRTQVAFSSGDFRGWATCSEVIQA